jgi:UPF0755 protein
VKLLKILAVFGFGLTAIATLGISGAALWAYNTFHKAGNFERPITVTIPSGAHVGNITEILMYAGVLDTASYPIVQTVFITGARLTGQDGKLKAGEYEIPAYASMKEVLDLLESGKVILRQVTIREGLTNWETKRFLRTQKDLQSEAELLMMPEGTYLPETYSYQKGENYIDVLNRMYKDRMNHLFEACGLPKHDWSMARADPPKVCPKAKLPLKSGWDVLRLASIVEKETGKAEERRAVAGVFMNRLRKGMLLQADSTVIYALNLGRHENEGQGPIGRRLLRKDLEFDHKYNTYKYAGLPPSPICNPGKASVEAALNPEEHDYLYFVADGTGGHVFSKTLAEHNRNVAKWRKIRKQQSRN